MPPGQILKVPGHTATYENGTHPTDMHCCLENVTFSPGQMFRNVFVIPLYSMKWTSSCANAVCVLGIPISQVSSKYLEMSFSISGENFFLGPIAGCRGPPSSICFFLHLQYSMGEHILQTLC